MLNSLDLLTEGITRDVTNDSTDEKERINPFLEFLGKGVIEEENNKLEKIKCTGSGNYSIK